MTYEQILADLKKKVFHPVYFLTGEETYYIDKISDYIEEHALDEAEKGFNQTILYGRETNVGQIIENAKRFPMMANHQVVIIKEAQDVKDIDKIEPYIKSPLKSTLLVICYKYKSLDKRKTFAKTITKNAVYFESPRLYDNKIPQWISDYLKEKNYKINPKAALLLTEYLGSELSKIANELDKLQIILKPGTEITPQHIEENIGISKEYNNFELQNAIGQKNVLKANRIINYFSKNPKDNPLVVTVGILYSFFNKLFIYQFLTDKSKNNVASALKISPYFVADFQTAAKNYNPHKIARVFSLLKETDLKSKGIDSSGTKDSELLKELIYKIIH
jgi:DNA polymerase III subunit delta